MNEHCSNASYNHGTHKIHWINKLRKEGLKPVVKILDLTNSNDYYEIEQYWIEQFRQWGHNLVNCADYGPGNGKRPLDYKPFVKPVLCYDTKGDLVGVYESGREAAKQLDISYKHINSTITGKRKITNGYRFRYYLGGTVIVDKIEEYKYRTSRAKPVYQFNLNNELINKWDHREDAAEELGVRSQGITYAINSKTRFYSGSLWSYTNKI